MVPEHHKATIAYGDHIARYQSAAPLVKGKTILDIACGSGYGTQMLAQTANEVYGVDIDKGAVEYAKKNFNNPNITFKVGSGTKIPIDNNSVESVVTFETLEHIKEAEKFLREIKRVLKPKGQLILSTPNDLEFPEGNHFHVHEYEHKELVDFLKKHFKYVDSYYQGTWLYSGVSNDKMIFEESDEKIRIINAAPLKPEQVLFFMLICSDEPIQESISPIGVLSEHWSSKQVGEQGDELQAYIKDTISHYEGILKAKEEQIAELNKHKTDLDNIKKSKAWRLAKRLSSTKAKISPK